MKRIIDNIYIDTTDYEVPPEHAKLYVAEEKHIGGFKEDMEKPRAFMFIKSKDGEIKINKKCTIDGYLFFMKCETDRKANIYIIYDKKFYQEVLTLIFMFYMANNESDNYNNILYDFMNKVGDFSLRNATLNNLEDFYKKYRGVLCESSCG